MNAKQIIAVLFTSCLLLATGFAQNLGVNGEHTMKITIAITSDSGNHTLTATLVDNSSAKAFYELLQKEPVTLKMQDYNNFEKYGTLSTSLPRNDEQITTSAGDLILYQGTMVALYYDKNDWNFTRLGKVDEKTSAEIKTILGRGNVTAVFSLVNTAKGE